MRLRDFTTFIDRRYQIYLRRKKGLPAPWTRDLILAQYRFCNVHREHDRVTQWITQNWRKPYEKYPELWFWLVVARMLNRVDSLRLLTPGPWDHTKFVRVLHDHHISGGKVFGAAYIISTGGKRMDKVEYIAEYVLDPLWQARRELRPQIGQTLAEYCGLLRQYDGLGSFMGAQVIADIKYVPPLRGAKDWWTFASSGPGSRRGLNRVLGREVKEHWNEAEWYAALHRLWRDTKPLLARKGVPKVHMQDLQNCLCEFDKYERARLDQGRPKQNFIPFSTKQLSLFGGD